MSSLRKKLAEIQQTPDGKYVDTETGEMFDTPPANKEDMSYEDKVKNMMQGTPVKRAIDDFPDARYRNGWGKVSPLNIFVLDNMQQMYGADPKTISDALINTIEGLNAAYGANDDTYSYFSKEKIKEYQYNLSQKRTFQQALDYLQNALLKGDSGRKKKAGSEEDNSATEQKVSDVMHQLDGIYKQFSTFSKSAQDIVSSVEELEGPEFADLFRKRLNELEVAMESFTDLIDGVLPQL